MFNGIKNKKTLFIGGSSILLLLCLSLSILYTCSRNIRSSHSPSIANRHEFIDKNKYDILARDWNRGVNNINLGDSFRLPVGDPEKLIAKLNRIFAKFVKKNREAELHKMEEIAIKYKYSFPAFYKKFLEQYLVEKQVHFDVNESSIDVKKKILSFTKTQMLDTKTIKIIASVTDPCLFFKIYKQQLWKDGLSRNIDSCDDLHI